jgi:mono/diheme cytochrome c family protein
MTKMNDRMVTCGMLLLFVTLVVTLAVLAACESQGAKLFWSNRCKECHTIDGKGGSSGPNLTYVGSKRSREYIVQQIKDPKSHNPNTDMPSFRSDLSEQEINAIADYLSGLN